MTDWAVKYRPDTLDGVVGQTLNINILKSRLQNPYQTMIFYGSSGCGKTTTARALAHDLKAEAMELDAAANNSVDNAREIIEYVARKSIMGSYKLIIIDECHLLSRQAWNALLKTIEEPPPKVVFIFCTTEYKSLPATILGRAQLFKFYPLKQDELMSLYNWVAQNEGIDLDKSLVEEMTVRTRYQVRDFLKLLQKAVDAGVHDISELDNLTSTPPIAMAGAYLQGVLKGDVKLAVSALKKIKIPLIEWKDRLMSLIYEIQEDKFQISELRYSLVQSEKLRSLGTTYKPREFGAVLSRLNAIKREEEAYALLFTLALQGVSQ